MNHLNCTVHACAHNSTGLCALSSIHVGGVEAHTSAQTACKSFREKTDAVSNAAGQPASAETGIRCDACHCTYNDECHCTAPDVNVCHCADGTECKTFRE